MGLSFTGNQNRSKRSPGKEKAYCTKKKVGFVGNHTRTAVAETDKKKFGRDKTQPPASSSGNNRPACSSSAHAIDISNTIYIGGAKCSGTGSNSKQRKLLCRISKKNQDGIRTEPSSPEYKSGQLIRKSTAITFSVWAESGTKPAQQQPRYIYGCASPRRVSKSV